MVTRYLFRIAQQFMCQIQGLWSIFPIHIAFQYFKCYKNVCFKNVKINLKKNFENLNPIDCNSPIVDVRSLLPNRNIYLDDREIVNKKFKNS